MDSNDVKTTEARLKQIRAILHQDGWVYGLLLAYLQFEITDRVPTMATDGRRLYVNPAFALSLTAPQMIGVLVHELEHCRLGHWREATWGARRGVFVVDAVGNMVDLRNVAMDYVINHELTNNVTLGGNKIELPAGALIDTKYDSSWCWQMVYDDLLKLGVRKVKGICIGDAEGAKDDGGVPLDKGEQEQLAAAWKRHQVEAVEMAQRAGQEKGNTEQWLKHIHEPEYDWRNVAREVCVGTLVTDTTWVPPNRRFLAHGIILPSEKREGCGPFVVMLDSSGSTYYDPQLQADFHSELIGIVDEVRPQQVEVVYCDTEVHQPIEIYGPQEEVKLRVPGGGGTDFRAFFRWLRQREGPPPQMVVAFTDMETCGWANKGDEPSVPVLWMDYGLGNVRPPFGTVARMRRK